MKFSVVITTYNRLSLLKRAIDSALDQTQPCEVVVADDCSTDGTADYVRSLGDRVIYCRNQTNQGHATTMNAGVQAATGDWIKPLDDDDYLASDCIAQIKQALEFYQNYQEQQGNLTAQAVICSGQAAQVDPDGVELSRTRAVGAGEVFYIPQADIHYGMLLEQVPFGTPIQVAFARDAFVNSGGWDSSLDANCDDIDSWIKIAQFGDAIFMNHCLGYRTVWPGAYNYRFSLEKRMETNILMKEKIYDLIHPRHRDKIPSLQSIRDYVKLHWGGVALKQGKILEALQLGATAISSSVAWKLLVNSRIKSASETTKDQIDKIVLSGDDAQKSSGENKEKEVPGNYSRL